MSHEHKIGTTPDPHSTPLYEATAWDRFIQRDPKISYTQGMMMLLERPDEEIRERSRGMARKDLLGTVYRSIRMARLQREHAHYEKHDVL